MIMAVAVVKHTQRKPESCVLSIVNSPDHIQPEFSIMPQDLLPIVGRVLTS